jgi:hypothetical protein
MKITKPTNIDTSLYYFRYVSFCKGEDLVAELKNNTAETIDKLFKMNMQDLQFTYADGKWSIGVLLQHICDAERVYAYRALRFLRADSTELPGFDEDAFAQNSTPYESLDDFIEEFSALRAASIQLFAHKNLKYLDFQGNANGLGMTPRILGYLMIGHCQHHMQILHERYLSIHK